MKDSTRNIILNVSKTLFNERGFYNVSLRQIAAQIGISQGNLNYHFKKKEEILKELFRQSVETVTTEFVATTKLGANFYFLLELARKTYEVQVDYRFLISDRIYLMDDVPELRNQYGLIKTQRINEFNQLFKAFIQKGYMREAEFETEYEELGLRLFLLGIYTIPDLEIDFKSDRVTGLKRYLQIITTSFYPYLTEEGKKKYFETLEEYKV